MKTFNVHKSVKQFKQTHHGIWIPNPYHDEIKDADVGHIVQFLLTGVRGDRETKPDFHGYELKTTTGQVSLCTKGCYIKPEELLRFGKRREDGKIEAYQKFFYERESDTALYEWNTSLELLDTTLALVWKNKHSLKEERHTLSLDLIEQAYRSKLNNLILCSVEKGTGNNRNKIKINDMIICEDFSFEKFCQAIRDRTIWYETRVRTGKNRGNTFRLPAKKLPALYGKTTRV
jgi:hypothetical protein